MILQFNEWYRCTQTEEGLEEAAEWFTHPFTDEDKEAIKALKPGEIIRVGNLTVQNIQE
jgi:hypothetical protein